MTSHNKTIKPHNWRTVKSEIIREFGTVRAAARALGCHPNSIYYAAQGRCPRVWLRLRQQLP